MMRITVQFQDGTRAEALVLAANRNQIRVVVAGRGETEAWSISGDEWFDETGRHIEVEAMAAVAGLDCAQLLADIYPRTATAGRVS